MNRRARAEEYSEVFMVTWMKLYRVGELCLVGEWSYVEVVLVLDANSHLKEPLYTRDSHCQGLICE